MRFESYQEVRLLSKAVFFKKVESSVLENRIS